LFVFAGGGSCVTTLRSEPPEEAEGTTDELNDEELEFVHETSAVHAMHSAKYTSFREIVSKLRRPSPELVDVIRIH